MFEVFIADKILVSSLKESVGWRQATQEAHNERVGHHPRKKLNGNKHGEMLRKVWINPARYHSVLPPNKEKETVSFKRHWGQE